MASQRALQFAGIADWAAAVTRRFAGRAPALPNVRSDGGYLAFFEKVVEALEVSVSWVEEEDASSARKLVGLALTLVFSNLCRLVPELDLQRVVEPVPAESRRLLRDEVRTYVDALVARYV